MLCFCNHVDCEVNWMKGRGNCVTVSMLSHWSRCRIHQLAFAVDSASVHPPSYIACSYSSLLLCGVTLHYAESSVTFALSEPDQRGQHHLGSGLRGHNGTSRPTSQPGAQLSSPWCPSSFSTTSSAASSYPYWTSPWCSSTKQESPGENRKKWAVNPADSFYISKLFINLDDSILFTTHITCNWNILRHSVYLFESRFIVMWAYDLFTTLNQCISPGNVCVMLYMQLSPVEQDMACWHIWTLKVSAKNAALRLRCVCVCVSM